MYREDHEREEALAGFRCKNCEDPLLKLLKAGLGNRSVSCVLGELLQVFFYFSPFCTKFDLW